jgi:hypothetical protein
MGEEIGLMADQVNRTVEQIVFEGVDRLTAISKNSEAAVKTMRQALDGVKDALGAIGVTVGVGAFVNLEHQALQAEAALADMAKQTGASVEGLSAIQRVAKVGGRDFDGLTVQLGRMVKGLRDGTGEGTKAGEALAFLGIKSREVDGSFRDTSAVLLDLAQKLAKYRDDGSKMQIVQDALGKGAERYIPLLEDMAKGTDLHATVTAKQAAAAEEAEKNIRRLHLAMEDARRETVDKFTPAITRLTEQLLEGSKIAGGFGKALLNFGTIDPGKSLRENIEQTQQALDDWQKSGGIGRFFQKPLGVNYDEVPDFLKKRLEFLKLLQRQQALAGAEGVDTGDQVSRYASRTAQPLPSANYHPVDPAEARKRELVITRQQIEGQEELNRQQREYDAELAKQDKDKLDLFKKLQDGQRDLNELVARGAILGTTQQDEDPRNNPFAARTAALEAYRNSLKDEAQLEMEAYNQRLVELQSYSDMELEALGGRNAAEKRLELDHAAQLFAIRRRSLDQLAGYTRSSWQGQAATVLGFVQDMTAGVTAQSRFLFEVNKIATIANIAIKTPSAIASAYEFGAKFGGPPLGAVMAGLAAASMAAQAAAAASTNFGGGSAPSISGTTAAPPVTPVAAEAPAPQKTFETRVVILTKTPMQRQVIEELADGFKELAKDGYPMPFALEPA